jgi:tripartite-type tricarboxylate transporter receptor subunit TctC
MKRVGNALIFTMAGILASVQVFAQTYPAKPIRMLVGYAAGGVTDSAARLIAEDISPRIGQPIVVENRPGASGQISHDSLKLSAPDGYTIELLTTPTIVATLVAGKAISASEMTPIAMHYDGPFPILVSTSAPYMASVRTLKDLVAVVKANPGQVNYTSAGTGSTGHLLGAAIGLAADLQWTHVGYKGPSLAATDLLAGRISMVMTNMPNDIQLIKEGKLRAIGTSGLTRLSSYDAPSIGEVGFPELAVTSWGGFVGPAGLPKNMADRLSTELKATLDKPDLIARLTVFNSNPAYQSGEALSRRVREDIEKFSRIVKQANIKIE